MTGRAIEVAGRWWRHLAVPSALVALVAVLATLQYRWVGQIADAERQRMQASAQARANQFAEEVDRELTSLFFSFSQLGGAPSQLGATPEDADHATVYAGEYARWAATSAHARLVRALFLVQEGGASSPVQKLTPGGSAFQPADWPPQLAAVRSRLETGAADRARSFFPQFDPQIPGLVVPVTRFSVSDLGGTPGHMRIANLVGLSGCLVVELDRDYIGREWLPALAHRYFAISDGFDYNLAVLDSASQSFVYVSDAGLSRAVFARPDVKTTLFQVRFDQVEKLVVGRAAARPGSASRSFQLAISTARDGVAGSGGLAKAAPPWQLLLAHRAGSLEAAIAQSRRRNLGVSFGILALLAVSLGLIVLSTRRAANLARQQVVFVAGVSHELRTPLSVICSAAENLSDGVVVEQGQVRRYGALIAAEGRRLAEMVEQVMAFAGLHAGRDLADRQTVSVADVIEKALEASASAIAQQQVRVEKALSADVPHVFVNVRAIQRALQNLIDNAIKYGGEGRWMRVGAASDQHGEAAITVEDHGLGILPEEQRRIFEPFFRGRDVAASSIHGSGLGLSLVKRIVEAHDGTVTVSSAPGRGTAFTIHLPAARPLRGDAAAAGVQEPAG
jgi:signal transduction histidine kinase